MKKVVVVGLLLALALVFSMPAGAWFTDKAVAKVLGHTGYVKICTANVRLVPNFQPGDTQWVSIPLRNQGRCPIIVKAKVKGLPPWLKAKIQPVVVQRISPGGGHTFRLYVWMPKGVGNAQMNKPIKFQVEFSARNLATSH